MGYKGTTSGRFIDNLPKTIEAIQDDANVLKRDMANLKGALDRFTAIAAGNVLTGIDYNALNAGQKVRAIISVGNSDSLYNQPTQTTILWRNGVKSSIVSSSPLGQSSAGWGMVCAIPFDTGKEITTLRVYFNYASSNDILTLQKA